MPLRLTLANLPAEWVSMLKWGPCICDALIGEECPSCANVAQIEAAGADWHTEYDRAIEAGEAIVS